MKLYLTGPITNFPDYAYAFSAWEAMLISSGYEVSTPIRNGLPESAPYEEHMKADFALLKTCDGLAVLPNAFKSAGSIREIAYAKELGLQIEAATKWLAMKGVKDVRPTRF